MVHRRVEGALRGWQSRMLREPPSPDGEGLGILETDSLEESVCAEMQSVTEARQVVQEGLGQLSLNPRSPVLALRGLHTQTAPQLLIARPMGGGNLASSKLS